MPSSCVVPGCKSNYKTQIKTEGCVSIFKFPKDPNLRNAWIRAIPRDNWEPSANSVVCIKHFHPADVSWVEQYKDIDGNWHERIRERPILHSSAIPELSSNLPTDLSGIPTKKRKPPEELDNEFEKRTKKTEDEEKRKF